MKSRSSPSWCRSLLFVIVGAAFVRPDYLSWSSSPPLLSVMSASGVLIFAFLGIEGALQPSGEVREPSRTVPRAVFLAIAGVVALYIAIQVVAQGLLGSALPDDRVAPLAQAAATVVGPAGRTFMLVGATISMFGFLCGTVLTGPRSLFAFAQAGFAPRALAAVHASRRTPHIAIVVYVAIALGLALVRIVRKSADPDERQRAACLHRCRRRRMGTATTGRSRARRAVRRAGRSRSFLRSRA